jgi:hypothetical protein
VSEAKALLRPRREADPRAYTLRPVAFAEEVLGVRTLTEAQKDILRLLHEPPCRVLVPSAHDTGKTFVAAVAALYWHYSFDPGLVLTTAPTDRDVVDLLWAEVRTLCQRAGLQPPFVGPKAPEIYDHPDHYAKGYVSRLGQGFQGRHRPRMLFIKDEANDVDALHWTTTRSMFDPALGHAELAIFNPTSTTSQAYVEDRSCDDGDGRPRWHRRRLSALDHPNVRAELLGQSRPVPGAVSLAMVMEWLRDWCEPLAAGDEPRATDVRWPPAWFCRERGVTPAWYRPGPIFMARAQGLWPLAGDSVWSEAAWLACLDPDRPEPTFPADSAPELGVDCSLGKGEDYFALHGRWGTASLLHETSNTMDAVAIAGKVRQACAWLAAFANARRDRHREPWRPQQVSVKIDDDGTGNAVAAILRREGYSCQLISAATRPLHPDLYPRMRDEAWFAAAGKAERGLIDLRWLDRRTLARLRQQLQAPAWELDTAGLRCVEKKQKTKEKLGRSPDDADALLLAYLDVAFAAPVVLPPGGERDPLTEWGDPSEERRHGRPWG